MLSLGAGARRVYLAVGATDLRKGFDGLYGLVRSRLEEDPLSGQLFVFCNAGRTRVKALYFDGYATRAIMGHFFAGKDSQGAERSKWSSAGSHNFARNRFLELKSICRWGRRNVGKLLSDPWSLDSYEKGLFCSTHIWRSFATTKHRFHCHPTRAQKNGPIKR